MIRASNGLGWCAGPSPVESSAGRIALEAKLTTSGRSFWILDDLGLLTQYQKDTPAFGIFKPESAYLANGSSELNKTDPEFKGMGSGEGVNPANGIVFYYQLPEIKPGDIVSLEIKDGAGKLVRAYSSKKDSLFKSWEGGPSEEPVLSAEKGLNRFVWNMRHPTLPGIPDTYFENSFNGHKASPGVYTASLKWDGKEVSTKAEILANPLYPTRAAAYAEYDRVMSDMEHEVRQMHLMVNTLNAKRLQLEELVTGLSSELANKNIVAEGNALVAKMKAWDEDMVQRKSKAYDDVENFPNKFSANYFFMLNQTESDIPQVNQPSMDLKKELDAEWALLKKRGTELLENDIPALNAKLWKLGIGGIWKR